MLSVAKLVAGAEEYYLNTVASGLEEYYTGVGEAPGHWLGSAAAELGLSGEVDAAGLAAVLRGRSPLDGSSLTGRSVSADRRVAGFDVTLSAPKSVSLLYGLGPAEVGEAVRQAHDDAVSDALAYLDAHAAMARRSAGGAQTIGTAGLVTAAFRHRTSRAGDPQLHTHVLVANLVRADDGKWSSLHAKLLYNQGRSAGFVYQAALRAGLVERLGVRFGPIDQGAAEIQGAPRRLLEEFSKRRVQIVAHLDVIGSTSPRAAEIATLATRQPKQPAGAREGTISDLHEFWRDRARTAGIAPEALLSVLGPQRERAAFGEAVGSIAHFLLGPDGLTGSTSTFQRRDVVRGVAERMRDGARVYEIEAMTDAVVADERVVRLGVAGRGGEELSTTAELLAIEARLIETALSSLGSGRGLVHPVITGTVLAERPGISAEQAEMVRQLTSSGNGVDVVVGKAGTGKTFALDAARASWQRAGFQVRGAALAARAAAELESGAGIASTTLASLRMGLERGQIVLGPSDIVVLDETGMIGTRALQFLEQHVEAAGAKVVLVGDFRQLPEIEAGGGLRSLAARVGALELHENRRQTAAWERGALDELRAGDVGIALVAYGEHERVHLVDSAGAARASMVKEWAVARSEGGTARMYALRRSDVDELNALARVELRRRNELGDDVASLDSQSFAEGDEVLFLRNDAGLGVLNGTRGVISSATDAALAVSTERGAIEVPFEYLEAGHLSLGYASTVHKAQGATIERAFVLGGEAMYREAGYVAMSRATMRTDLYVVTSAFEDGWDPSLAEVDPIAGLQHALTASRAKHLAIESLAADRELDLHSEAAVLRRELGHDRHTDMAPALEARDGHGRLRSMLILADKVGSEAANRASVPRGEPFAGGGMRGAHVGADRHSLIERAARLGERLHLELAVIGKNRHRATPVTVGEVHKLGSDSSPDRGGGQQEPDETTAILALLGAHELPSERERGQALGRSR